MPDLQNYENLLTPLHEFLPCPTPASWLAEARRPEHLPELLLDHLHCELKAAQSAALLLRRYIVTDQDQQQILAWLKPYEDCLYRGARQPAGPQQQAPRLSREGLTGWQQDMQSKLLLLIKEELHHFVQVLEILTARGIPLRSVSASRYAAGLLRQVRTYEPATLIDKLIVGAFIEARSCERFAALAPHLEADLARFYIALLRSEARHYADYLKLAEELAEADISDRVAAFRAAEQDLIEKPDAQLRFHSGVPIGLDAVT